MIIYTAPVTPECDLKGAVSVFLAGGISGCPNWQKEVIEHLGDYPDTDDLIVFNPRGDIFEKDEIDKDDLYVQWRWENYFLKNIDIFSIYFCEGKSQSFSMYELGKFFGVKVISRNGIFTYSIPILSTEKGFSKFDGILCRTAFEFDDADDIITNYKKNGIVPSYINANATPESHAKRIYDEYCRITGIKEEKC